MFVMMSEGLMSWFLSAVVRSFEKNAWLLFSSRNSLISFALLLPLRLLPPPRLSRYFSS